MQNSSLTPAGMHGQACNDFVCSASCQARFALHHNKSGLVLCRFDTPNACGLFAVEPISCSSLFQFFLCTEMSRSHHFQGLDHYADRLMDLAEGRPVFTGKGQKPSNKEVLSAIDAIHKCRQGSFFSRKEERACSCGWHKKAAARKRAKQTVIFSPARSADQPIEGHLQAGSTSAVESPTAVSSLPVLSCEPLWYLCLLPPLHRPPPWLPHHQALHPRARPCHRKLDLGRCLLLSTGRITGQPVWVRRRQPASG